MKTDQEIYAWIDTQAPDPVIDADGDKLYYRETVFEMLKDFVAFNEQVDSPAPEPKKTLFEMLVAGEICIDMRGSVDRSNRITKLQRLIEAILPESDHHRGWLPSPKFYHFKHGRILVSTNGRGKRKAYNPIDIEIPKT